MELPFTVPELRLACWELVGANGLADGFLRSLAYYGYGEFGVSGRGNPVDVALLSWGSGSGPSEVSAGVRMTVSSWRRASPNVIPQGAKSPAVSVNSLLAVNEAHRAGYDDAIFLTDLGFVAGASSENIFVVRHGVLHTPDLSTSTVLGITRDTVIEIAHALGYRIVERQVIRTDLQVADEIFVCGTAAGVTAVREVDDHVLGTAGPITTEIHATYNELVHGRLPVGGELATGLAGWPEVEPPPRVPETR
jgi:branched-chain amino acid aminotransferase